MRYISFAVVFLFCNSGEVHHPSWSANLGMVAGDTGFHNYDGRSLYPAGLDHHREIRRGDYTARRAEILGVDQKRDEAKRSRLLASSSSSTSSTATTSSATPTMSTAACQSTEYASSITDLSNAVSKACVNSNVTDVIDAVPTYKNGGIAGTISPSQALNANADALTTFCSPACQASQRQLFTKILACPQLLNAEQSQNAKTTITILDLSPTLFCAKDKTSDQLCFPQVMRQQAAASPSESQAAKVNLICKSCIGDALASAESLKKSVNSTSSTTESVLDIVDSYKNLKCENGAAALGNFRLPALAVLLLSALVTAFGSQSPIV